MAEEPKKQDTEEQNKPETEEKNPRIIPKLIEEEMKKSYLDYSMSVIVGRALPDVRDGLKPVHRRILFAMHEMGLLHNKPFKKCATVVGTVLGRYHPHGDTAVYESLVRMAQDWSLRYPLVDGQGNFGCFTADTKVKLTDGRDLSFAELIKEHKQGKRNFTFTIADKGSIQIAEIKNPRMTRKNAEIMKVILDNGEEIKCTLNHKFMLRDSIYKEAKDFKSGASLMPLYLKLSTEKDKFKPSLRNYQMVYQPKTNKWVPCHNLADDWNLKNDVYKKSAGRIRHHINFNKLNNNPDNVKRIKWKDHWKFHSEHASKQHEDEDYRKSIATGRKRFWADSKNKKAYSKRLSEKNTKNWKNPIYRKKMTAFLSEINKEYIKKHPEKREELSKRATETLKRLWKDPKYREIFHNKIVASNKKRQTNLTGKKKFLKICKYLKDSNLSLDKENYEKVRKEVFGIKSFTSWGLGITKYYEGNNDLLLCELNNNHKVIKIEFLKEFVNVYDLTVDKTHNFALASGIFVHNSIDGDAPAAYRYTESRLKKISEEILQDIEKETVDFTPNFDNSLKEPAVLPSKLPNLLINGSSGIAVGMATTIPPHNLRETVDALLQLIDNPEITITGLMQHIKGPDFPTAGIIQGTNGIKQAFTTGRGRIILKARTEIEETKNKTKIIVKEIPYMVNKSQLVESIANLVRDKSIQGVSDIRDESDRKGMRIVIELRSDTNPDVVLNQLFKHTRMQTTFGVIMLALVNNVPKILNIKQLMHEFIEHRRIVVRRRTKYELTKAEERAHIIEGIIKALNNLDSTIKLIKESKSVQEAKFALIQALAITEKQATAILDMKLQRLTSLEQNKIREEHKELLKLIEELKSILASEQKILDIIKKELIQLKEKYQDERKTQIIEQETEEIEVEDLIEKEKVVITVSHAGYIKRQPVDAYKVQARGGKGIIAAGTREEDFTEQIFVASTHSYLLIFTNKGNIHAIKVYQIPEGSRTSKGRPIVNLIELDKDEKVTAYIPVKQFTENYFLMLATQQGIVKKTPLSEFSKPRRGGIRAITLDEKDRLIAAELTTGDKHILLATQNGLAIRFNEKDVRSIGRTGKGVKGITLKGDDRVIGMEIATDKKSLLTITENGYGKQTPLSEYRSIGRGGIGVINIQCTERNGKVVSVKAVYPDNEIIIMSQNGIVIRTEISGISTIGRNTQGVRLMKLTQGDKVVATANLIKESEQELEKAIEKEEKA